MKKARKRRGSPAEITTDGLPFYDAEWTSSETNMNEIVRHVSNQVDRLLPF